MNISSGRITPPRASVAGCVVAPRDHTIEVRHLFGKRFVSVLSFWCLTRRKPLILLDGASSAGIANGLWVRSQFGSPGSEANQFQADEISLAAPGSNSKSASSRLSGPQALLSALARQFDRDVPRGAHDPRASVRVGPANDRFQKQNELFRKHDIASLMVAFLVPSLVPSRLEALNSITCPRAARSARPDRSRSAPAPRRGRQTTEPGLIGATAGAYSGDEEVRRHLRQLPRRLPPGRTRLQKGDQGRIPVSGLRRGS